MISLPIGAKLACFDEEGLYKLWQRIRPFDNLFSDEDMRNPESFLKLFLAPDSVTIWVEDGGFVLLKYIRRERRLSSMLVSGIRNFQQGSSY